MSDTQYQFQIEPCYNAGQLMLRRINAPPEQFPAVPAPTEIHIWLNQRGWISENGGTHWTTTKFRDGFTWEQAVAIEFYKFINIGSEG